jgi:aldehyde dehydrogenase (NAD+)
MEEISILLEDQIKETIQLQKKSILRLRKSNATERIHKLTILKEYILSHKEEICSAMYSDFKKPASEVILAELMGIKREIEHTISHLKSWMRPHSVSTPLILMGTNAHIQYESKGMCLIISPWNYPLNLAICPMIQAIAAGNSIILKPSELTPNTSSFIKKMVSTLYDTSEVAVFEGDASVSTFLLEQKFDHIFFTGSPAIGKLVMKAASNFLTSVTLELGGKSPGIIGSEVDIQASARKIAWGKFLNNGQTCIAPDYLFIHEKVYFLFLENLEIAVKEFYNSDNNGIEKSPDFARIVNKKHFLRISNLLEDALGKGAKILFGGELNEADCFISPTVLTNCTSDMQIMKEEIFGPILPILSYKNEEEIVHYLENEEKPLALYVFSKDKEFSDYILQNTTSGSSVINDCLIQFGHSGLPFGGVNNSGIGKSGGHFGFIEFSNQKAVLVQKTNLLKMLYPPYTLKVRWILDFILKWF